MDDTEAAQTFLLVARGLVVDGEVHHHALVLLGGIVCASGCAAITRQAVAVRFAVRPVHHHALAVGKAACTRQSLIGYKRQELRSLHMFNFGYTRDTAQGHELFCTSYLPRLRKDPRSNPGPSRYEATVVPTDSTNHNR